MGVGKCAMICSVATRPLIVGNIMSMVTASGRSRPHIATACGPYSASPPTSRSGSAASDSRSRCRMVAESSTISTRIMPAVRSAPSCRDQPPDVGEQLLLIELALDHVRAGAHLDAAPAVLLAGPGADQD